MDKYNESNSNEENKLCEFCKRKKEKLNDENWKRHKAACHNKNKLKEKKEKEKHQRKVDNRKRKSENTYGSNLLTKFFKKKETEEYNDQEFDFIVINNDSEIEVTEVHNEVDIEVNKLIEEIICRVERIDIPPSYTC